MKETLAGGMEDFQENMMRQMADCLADLRVYRMPFGRYGPEHFPPLGKFVYQLPLEYLIWFQQRSDGFPRGRLGELMAFVYEIKSNGAEEVLRQLEQDPDEPSYW